VGLARGAASAAVFSSANPDSVERETRRLGAMGFEEGRHFTAAERYVLIRREGLVRVAKLSARGEGR
jgi:hypothetical protein